MCSDLLVHAEADGVGYQCFPSVAYTRAHTEQFGRTFHHCLRDVCLWSFRSVTADTRSGMERLGEWRRAMNWLLVSLIPFIGGLIVLFFALQGSQAHENEWGPSPKVAVAQ